MAQTKTRVHTLAKELGVTSKAIIAKCTAEGLPIQNHMTVLTAGQIETISEWFSEGPHATTVEVAERVDLKTVRRSRPKKAAAAKDQSSDTATETAGDDDSDTDHDSDHDIEHDAHDDDSGADDQAEPQVEAEEAPAETAPVETIKPAAAAPAAPKVVAPVEPVVSEPEAPTAPPTAAKPAPGEVRHAAKVPTVQPEKPAEEVRKPAAPPKAPPKPAGPQNVPTPAQLSGPKVIRMEKPDVLPRPRPASRPGGPRGGGMGGGGGGGGGGGYGGPRGPIGPTEPESPSRRRSAKQRQFDEEEAARKARARINPRRRDSDIGEKMREWNDRDMIERRERLDQASGRSHRAVESNKRRGSENKQQPGQQMSRPTSLELTEPIVVKEFCNAAGIPFSKLMPKMIAHGTIANLNTVIDSDMAEMLAMEFGLELTILKQLSPLEKLRQERESLDRSKAALRSPIVTILGHVDHGKTSLLDRIRKTKVAAGEAGGITQHIGAYHVKVGERYVAFLDTPGHAAFTEMRARGANLTDVVVLVVAADDGLMPQTIEAINHARAAKVPIVVALNKVDLPGIDFNKIYGELSEHKLTPQEWGGDTDVIKTSAISGQGIDELLEHLAALSDLLELKADASIPAWGTVVEAEKKEGVGPVARVMVREGTLKRGDVIVCGPAYGKVRAMYDENGKRLDSAGPAVPVEIAGLNDVPGAGDDMFVLSTVQEAKDIAEDMQRRLRDADLMQSAARPTDLAALAASVGGDDIPELNLIIKADVQGSVDVLRDTMSRLPTEEVKLNILHSGVGMVTDSDVSLAAASRAVIIAFNVLVAGEAQRKAQNAKVEVREYRVIYDAENDIRKALGGLLAPTETIESRGSAEVREVFNISKVGRIAGCIVRDGVIGRNHMVRVVRDGVPVKEGASLASLKRFKDDAREVRSGLECGIRIEGFDDVKPGDTIEAYEVIKVAREL